MRTAVSSAPKLLSDVGRAFSGQSAASILSQSANARTASIARTLQTGSYFAGVTGLERGLFGTAERVGAVDVGRLLGRKSATEGVSGISTIIRNEALPAASADARASLPAVVSGITRADVGRAALRLGGGVAFGVGGLIGAHAIYNALSSIQTSSNANQYGAAPTPLSNQFGAGATQYATNPTSQDLGSYTGQDLNSLPSNIGDSGSMPISLSEIAGAGLIGGAGIVAGDILGKRSAVRVHRGRVYARRRHKRARMHYRSRGSSTSNMIKELLPILVIASALKH